MRSMRQIPPIFAAREDNRVRATTCSECRFWGTISDPAECRRRAPVVDGGRACWPITQRNDWCGEYEAKPCDHDWSMEWIIDHAKPKERLPCCSKCKAVKGIDA